MTLQNQVYKCEICGNIVEILHEGVDALVCCGQSMKLQKENNKDFAKEKHIPVIGGNNVKIGEIEHPMTKEHYIEWIEATSQQGEISKFFLKPGMQSEANFPFKPISARAYCNLHGLWKSK